MDYSAGSTRFRFFFSLVANVTRAGISFATGLFTARVLGPENYGDLIFLLSSFTSIRALLDMGSSSAFYTFMSQEQRNRSFICIYLFWQFIQFFVVIALIAILLPNQWINYIWVEHDKSLVIAAFMATFFQHQIWQTVSQIGDSLKQTIKVQIAGLAVVIINFLFVLLLWCTNLMGVFILLIFILIEYFFSSLILVKILFRTIPIGNKKLDLKKIFTDYFNYCSPIIVLTFFGFCYTFFDNWILQKFGGSREQAFYGVAYQFSMISMFATISLLPIFWREVAESFQMGGISRVEFLYKKVTRLLYGVTAIVAGGLFPWTQEIISHTLGEGYKGGVSTFMLMLIYPLYQSIGQVTSTLLAAMSNTKFQMAAGIFSAIISIPISYVVMAPHAAYGFELGSLGMAIKLVLLTAITVNFISWWVCKLHKWKFDFLYQIYILIIVGLCSGLSFGFANGINEFLNNSILIRICIASCGYGLLLGTFIWSFPEIFGISKNEILHLFFGIKKIGKRLTQ